MVHSYSGCKQIICHIEHSERREATERSQVPIQISYFYLCLSSLKVLFERNLYEKYVSTSIYFNFII